MSKESPRSEWGRSWLPWAGGAALAAGHIAWAQRCALPGSGQCTGCGACAVTLAVLVGWALRQRRGEAATLYRDSA